MLSRYCFMGDPPWLLPPASCRLLTLYTNGSGQDRQRMDRAILQDLLEPIVIMTRSWRSIVCRVAGVSALLGIGLTPGVRLRAETGSELWLRYPPLTDAIQRTSYRQCVPAIALQRPPPPTPPIPPPLRPPFPAPFGP